MAVDKVIIPLEGISYNERLFSGGIRGFFHEGRFKWLFTSMQKLDIQDGAVAELGCFDGKTIAYLPFKPVKYIGYDANWEGGFDDALKKWKDYPQYSFVYCDKPAHFNAGNELFDYTIAMETLEHINTNDLEEYLQKLSAATQSYGFFSVPNERGLVFLLKHLTKKLFLKVDEPYTAKELWYAFTGQIEKVKRNEGGHKGFDYKKLISQLEKYFTIVSVKGIPFSYLPLSCNFTVGIVVKKK